MFWCLEKNSDVMLSMMARDRAGDWKGKEWFECIQNIQLCSAIKLTFNILSWWNGAMTHIVHTQLMSICMRY